MYERICRNTNTVGVDALIDLMKRTHRRGRCPHRAYATHTS